MLEAPKAKKGKKLSKPVWNKGKKGVQEAWNKGLKLPKTPEQIQQMVERRNLTMEKYGSSYGREKGSIPWNKGKTYHLAEDVRESMVEKMNPTKVRNNSFNTSKPEEEFYQYLITVFGEEDVVRQYTDSRYPFRCDFYIKSQDLFIELNLLWTHGGHPFDPESEEDRNLLEYWQTKAETSDFYKNAIETWTIRDVKKLEAAKKNNLNYITYYSLGELYND